MVMTDTPNSMNPISDSGQKPLVVGDAPNPTIECSFSNTSVVGFPTGRMLLLPLNPNALEVVKNQVPTLSSVQRTS